MRIIGGEQGLAAPEVAKAFVDGGNERGQAFADGPRIARQVDYQTAATGAGSGAGENGGGDLGETDGAHGLAEAGELAIEYGAGGLGGEIARGGSGASGGDDEVAGLVVAEGAEERRKGVAAVGDEAGEDLVVGAELLAEDTFDLGSAEVGVDTGSGAVAEGHAGDFHDLVLAVTRMAVRLMVLSTAFIMS
jgi:hypothetical protein